MNTRIWRVSRMRAAGCGPHKLRAAGYTNCGLQAIRPQILSNRKQFHGGEKNTSKAHKSPPSSNLVIRIFYLINTVLQ